ncbi:MAG: hypothetical protein INR69_15045, partial [Mucilaginibacter polytrichastri]|nr:hypothetical protein [Mucilaginibacter polytrichastri]
MQLATVEKNPFSSWLQSSRNYRDGLALLAGSSCSKVVLKMLEAGPGPFNSPKLAQVIQKLSNAWIAPVSKAIPKNVAEFLIPVPDTQIAQPASPAKLLAIRKEIADTWKQMCHYHGARAGAANDAQRYYFANRLMYLDDQRQHL